MRRLFLLIILPILNLYSEPFHLDRLEPKYFDEELNLLWGSIENINAPTYEDYQNIESYLMYGRRPYLDILFDHGVSTGLLKEELIIRWETWWNRLLQQLCFATSEDRSPGLNRVVLGVGEENRENCIVLYASCNKDTFDNQITYGKRLLQICEELKRVGYRGHVLYRIGSYPALEWGGIQFAHIPYSFKLLSLIEASYLGYRNVLWIDCATHPLNNLSKIFSKIRNKGLFFLHNGSNVKYDYDFKIIPKKTVDSWGVSISDLENIPHIWAGVIGVSFEHSLGHAFINEWYKLTTQLLPALSLYPEESLISVANYKIQSKAYETASNHLLVPPDRRPPTHPNGRSFWFDKAPKSQ